MLYNTEKIEASVVHAFIEVCKWATNPNKHAKPDNDILDRAEEYALRRGNIRILGKIEELRAYYKAFPGNITPKRPGATSNALKPIPLELSEEPKSESVYELDVITHCDEFGGTCYALVYKETNKQ